MASLGILILTSCSVTNKTTNTIQMKKQKVIIKTQFNFEPFTQVENSEKPSLTLENEAYTIRELFERHAQGILPEYTDMQYDDDPQFEDADFTRDPDVDLTDIDNAKSILENIESKKESKRAQAIADSQKVESTKSPETGESSHGDEGTNKNTKTGEETA